MTNVILVALMQIATLGAEQGEFEEAYRQSVVTGRPLVVLVGATWCPACQRMKNTILPEVAQGGGLSQVVFTYVDFDQHRQLASRLSRAKSIPQLIRFDRTPAGWKSKLLVGARSHREVHEFINAGLRNEAHVRGVSATTRPQDGSRKPVSGETSGADAFPAKVESRSSAAASKAPEREVRSLPAGKAGDSNR